MEVNLITTQKFAWGYRVKFYHSKESKNLADRPSTLIKEEIYNSLDDLGQIYNDFLSVWVIPGTSIDNPPINIWYKVA